MTRGIIVHIYVDTRTRATHLKWKPRVRQNSIRGEISQSWNSLKKVTRIAVSNTGTSYFLKEPLP